MTNAVCNSDNESWFIIHQCRLRAISRNKTTFNFNATVLHPANVIHLRIELFKKANTYMPWLVNETVDICRFLKRPFNLAVITVVNLFKEFTNFNHTCPYVVRHKLLKFAFDSTFTSFITLGTTNCEGLLSEMEYSATFDTNRRIFIDYYVVI